MPYDLRLFYYYFNGIFVVSLCFLIVYYFYICAKTKLPLGLNDNSQKPIMKIQKYPWTLDLMFLITNKPLKTLLYYLTPFKVNFEFLDGGTKILLYYLSEKEL